MHQTRDARGLVSALVDDGRPLLTLSAVLLFLSGAVAIFLSFRRKFLPHDVAFLGLSADALCAVLFGGGLACEWAGWHQQPA